jgi:beta-phosphoglucomutase-like phosphatase (HAD superfamily)
MNITLSHMNISGIIFDFDGTLVDTMPLHFEAYRLTFEEMGILLLPEQFYSAIGGNARESIPKFLKGRPAPWSIQQIHMRKKELLMDVLRTSELKVLPCGLLLQAFAGLIPVGLASSGSRQGIECMLQRLAWSDLFDAIITGEDAANGKPNPEPFLLAAKAIGVDSHRCLAFEDTDDGVTAARAAGMHVFDVRYACPKPLHGLTAPNAHTM